MVKGKTRRVIVVKPADKLFDEAIFIVRDDPDEAPGVTGEAIVKEAQKAAQDFMRSHLGKYSKIASHHVFWLITGAAAASFLWGSALLLLRNTGLM